MSLESALYALDIRRAALLNALRTVDEATLTTRLQPGRWTILEIVEHLVLSEQVVFGDLSTSVRPAPSRRGPHHHLRYGIVMLVLRLNVPVQAPAAAMLPQGGRTLAELHALWDANMERLRRFIGSLDAAGRRQAVFRHPFIGPVTPAQAIRMDRLHIARHARQIARIRASLAAAAG